MHRSSRGLWTTSARVADAGWIAEQAADGVDLGAAWVRRFTGDAPGFGYVDDVTPELSIVRAPNIAAGVGTMLLSQLLDDVPWMCLSVDVRNSAMRLYARLGFVEVRRDGFSATMLRAG